MEPVFPSSGQPGGQAFNPTSVSATSSNGTDIAVDEAMTCDTVLCSTEASRNWHVQPQSRSLVMFLWTDFTSAPASSTERKKSKVEKHSDHRQSLDIFVRFSVRHSLSARCMQGMEVRLKYMPTRTWGRKRFTVRSFGTSYHKDNLITTHTKTDDRLAVARFAHRPLCLISFSREQDAVDDAKQRSNLLHTALCCPDRDTAIPHSTLHSKEHYKEHCHFSSGSNQVLHRGNLARMEWNIS